MQNRIQTSAQEIKNIHSLVMCAVLVALYVAINSLSVYVTPTLKLTFSFLVLAIIGWRFGAVTGTFAGLACDLVAYVVRPAGPLHLGFTLSTMLTVAVFAILLYSRELKLWRIIVARTVINLTINIALLPIEIALLWFVLKAFEQIMKRVGNK